MDDDELEAMLFAEMERQDAPPPERVERPVKRPSKRPRPHSGFRESVAEAPEGDGGEDAPGYMWGMNIVTGKLREDEEAEAANAAAIAARDAVDGEASLPSHKPAQMVELRYGSYQGLQLSAAEVRRIKAEECRALLARKKLSLVLDLDHTLLNSVVYGELDAAQMEAVQAWAASEAGSEAGGEAGGEAGSGGKAGGDACSGGEAGGEAGSGGDGGGDAGSGGRQPSLYHLEHICMWTKLRPHVREFLAGASEMYELYVYTMGARAYAAEMTRLLDPTGALGLLQSDRVIGKEDSTVGHTKDLDVIRACARPRPAASPARV